MNNKLVISIPTILLILLAIYLFPWRKINWGTLRVGPERTVTVTGTASSEEMNQIARFSAGVTVSDDDKAAAVSEVESRMADLVIAVKEFGIEEKDIQTESVSVYEREEEFIERAAQNVGKWRASSSISITLRDIERASELTSLLASKETSNVYGPNFSLDDTQNIETKLLENAIKNAREKADAIAKAQGTEVATIINVVEGTQSGSIFPMMEAAKGGGGMPIEPGSTKVSKSVTVVFSLK